MSNWRDRTSKDALLSESREELFKKIKPKYNITNTRTNPHKFYNLLQFIALTEAVLIGFIVLWALYLTDRTPSKKVTKDHCEQAVREAVTREGAAAEKRQQQAINEAVKAAVAKERAAAEKRQQQAINEAVEAAVAKEKAAWGVSGSWGSLW